MRASRVAAAAAVAVAGLSQAALADFASDTPLVIDASTGLAPAGPTFAAAGPVDGAAISAVDGNYVFDLTLAGDGPQDVTTVAAWSLNRIASPTPSFVIHTGNVVGAYLAGVQFGYGGPSTAEWYASAPAEGALAPGANFFSFNFTPGPYGLTSGSGFGAGSEYSQVALLFRFPTSGASLQLDAVSNPEPGTFALFGLGAAGLAFAVRRRRAAKTAAKS